MRVMKIEWDKFMQKLSALWHHPENIQYHYCFLIKGPDCWSLSVLLWIL